jgi:aspartate/methionine/tyrosine aminotransferase
VRQPRARVLRDADGHAAAGRTDEDYVLALLRETGILCVYGSGFGVAPERGLPHRLLANPKELASIYADIAAFTGDYLQRAVR